MPTEVLAVVQNVKRKTSHAKYAGALISIHFEKRMDISSGLAILVSRRA
jgi:hypothetical protein